MSQVRVIKLKESLIKEKLDGVLISSVSNITYLTGFSNFSKDEREAYLIITENDQFIVTDGRYKEAILKEVPHFTLLELSSENSLKSIFEKLGQKIKILGIEEDDLTVSEHKQFKKHFKKLKHLSLKTHRSIKTDEEIRKIENAASLGDQAFSYILKKIKGGISEKEVAFEMENFIKKNGADLSFPSIVAFGKNSSVPHHQRSDAKLDKSDGQFVLIDMGVKLKNYSSDMTRTIFFGKPSNKQREIYQVVLEAQKRAVEFINSEIKSGKKIKAAEVDRVARTYFTSKGFPTIPHSLGHGIGLEVHEHPSLSHKSRDILKSGMVFSIEPGIYIEGFGGVRIEDLYVLESGGLRQLTTPPKNLIEI